MGEMVEVVGQERIEGCQLARGSFIFLGLEADAADGPSTDDWSRIGTRSAASFVSATCRELPFDVVCSKG